MDIPQIAKILIEDITYNNGLSESSEQELSKCPMARLRPVNPDETYNQDQLKQGIEVEKEHTFNPNLAKIITKHHLDEIDPKKSKYYTKLDKLEKSEEEEIKEDFIPLVASTHGQATTQLPR